MFYSVELVSAYGNEDEMQQKGKSKQTVHQQYSTRKQQRQVTVNKAQKERGDGSCCVGLPLHYDAASENQCCIAVYCNKNPPAHLDLPHSTHFGNNCTRGKDGG